MRDKIARSASLACLIISAALLCLSILCLCLPGEMVGYFLVTAAIGLIPLGFDSRRMIKILSLGVVVVAMTLAHQDHNGGMKLSQRLAEARGRAAAKEQSTTQSIAATTMP
jgi:hypothetical protein